MPIALPILDMNMMIFAALALVGGFVTGIAIKKSITIGIILLSVFIVLMALGYIAEPVAEYMSQFTQGVLPLLVMIKDITVLGNSMVYMVSFFGGLVIGIWRG